LFRFWVLAAAALLLVELLDLCLRLESGQSLGGFIVFEGLELIECRLVLTILLLHAFELSRLNVRNHLGLQHVLFLLLKLGNLLDLGGFLNLSYGLLDVAALCDDLAECEHLFIACLADK